MEKKNVLLALLAIVLVPVTADLAAMGCGCSNKSANVNNVVADGDEELTPAQRAAATREAAAQRTEAARQMAAQRAVARQTAAQRRAVAAPQAPAAPHYRAPQFPQGVAEDIEYNIQRSGKNQVVNPDDMN